MKKTVLLILMGAAISFTACETTAPDNGTDTEISGNDGNSDTGGNGERPDDGGVDNSLRAAVSRVERSNGQYSIYVKGIYADPDVTSKDYLTVGFCADTDPEPVITDITIPEAIENPTSNSVRQITGLEAATEYHIRPYHVSGGRITYYEGTSVETLGGSIDIEVSIQSDHQFGLVKYDIGEEGTYHLTVSFWKLGGIIKKDLGYAGKESGRESFDVGTYLWDSSQDCTATLTCLETGIAYSDKIKCGWSAN